MRIRNMGTPTFRFWARVSKTDTCWNWTGAPAAAGYGRLMVNKHAILAHRFSWVLHGLGELVPAQHLDHICGNRACVNPEHLRIVTPKQNHENRRGARRDSESGVRGVWRCQNGRPYQASINHNKERFYLGRFDSLEDAERAVIKKRLELYTHNERDKLDAIRLGIAPNIERSTAA